MFFDDLRFSKGVRLIKLSIQKLHRCLCLFLFQEYYNENLPFNHEFTVTDVRKVEIGNKPVSLIRIRNPWGNKWEWKGSFSDG